MTVHAVLRIVVLVLAALSLPAALGAPSVVGALTALNAPRTDGASAPPAPTAHDPGKPTAVVVVGDRGAVVSDTLAPYEILATTGAFNVYAVASEAHPVPLTGGLDLVPDLTFAGLENLLGGPADLVVVPAMPDVGQATTKPVTDWLATQANGGACSSASATGRGCSPRPASSTGTGPPRTGCVSASSKAGTRPWSGFEARGTSTTAGSSARRASCRASTARCTSSSASSVRMPRPTPPRRSAGGTTTPTARLRCEQARLGASDAVVAFNTAFGWDRPTAGVLLTDGVGEIELASVFDTYGQSLAVGTLAVGAGPVQSRHGLTFVPRAETAAGLARLVVPGTTGHAAVAGPEPVHPHHGSGFPFDGVLQDLARTTDVATARWTAKVLEYPIDDLALSGPAWPWTETLRPVGLAAVGVLAALGVFALVRRARGGSRREDAAPAGGAGEA